MTDEPNENCRRCGKPFYSLGKKIGGIMDRLNLGGIPSEDVYCPSCYEKEWEEYKRKSESRREEKVSCRNCGGTGKIKGYKCMHCGGKGYR